jgi:uracil-DNA glycosylase
MPGKRQLPSPSLAYVPEGAHLQDLIHAAKGCQACDLYKRATQTVFGEGPVPAPLVLIGEQPGDQEDRDGHPFVGPAGRLLDAALEEADVPRDQVFVTNAVKHFKWEPRGKRRLHSKPNAAEIHACQGWLEAELALVKPELVVCLGATAAQALLGKSFRITKQRGEIFDGAPWAPHVMATYHPSALLRMRSQDEAAYLRAKAELEADLTKASAMVTFRRTRGRVAKGLRARAGA